MYRALCVHGRRDVGSMKRSRVPQNDEEHAKKKKNEGGDLDERSMEKEKRNKGGESGVE